MTTFDYILLIVAAVVLIYQVRLLLRMKRDVLIPGVPPHRKTVGVLMALINLMVDIIYAFCDPRIKAQYSRKG